jgi:hypothetical protein
MRKILGFLPLILLPAIAWSADLDATLKRLARPAPAVTPFIEARFSKLLTKPLIVSGQLEYTGPESLARTVTSPFKERTEIKDATVTVTREGQSQRRFSLKRAPELRLLLDSFAALLGGDRSVLEQEFNLDLQGDDNAWTLTMTPKDARIKQRIRDIVVNGTANEPRCLTSTEPNDNASIMLLASAAGTKLPSDPQRSWFENFCRPPSK